MSEKELHVCACITESYFPLYHRLFNKTLPTEFNSITLHHARNHNSQPGCVGEKNFKHINYQKLHFVRQQLSAHRGENLLVLDLDIVFFRDFKKQINTLLEQHDMIFQRNNTPLSPLCIGVWGLQCSDKNINFFDKEVLPRAEALLKTAEEWEELHRTKTPVPNAWFAWREGKQTYYDGDQCVINAAALTPLGQDLKIHILPDTYANEESGGPAPHECVLYHGTGAQGQESKAHHLYETYYKIKEKIEKATGEK